MPRPEIPCCKHAQSGGRSREGPGAAGPFHPGEAGAGVRRGRRRADAQGLFNSGGVMTKSQAQRLFFRPAVPNDLAAIHGIELSSEPVPWSWKQLQLWHGIQEHSTGVCEQRGVDGTHYVIGFVAYSIQPDYFDLERFAVAPGMRKRGIGKA